MRRTQGRQGCMPALLMPLVHSEASLSHNLTCWSAGDHRRSHSGSQQVSACRLARWQFTPSTSPTQHTPATHSQPPPGHPLAAVGILCLAPPGPPTAAQRSRLCSLSFRGQAGKQLAVSPSTPTRQPCSARSCCTCCPGSMPSCPAAAAAEPARPAHACASCGGAGPCTGCSRASCVPAHIPQACWGCCSRQHCPRHAGIC